MLSRMFIKAENDKTAAGIIKIAKSAPSISHLFFAGDSFIITGATIKEARETNK